jgi:hypothetical protein
MTLDGHHRLLLSTLRSLLSSAQAILEQIEGADASGSPSPRGGSAPARRLRPVPFPATPSREAAAGDAPEAPAAKPRRRNAGAARAAKARWAAMSPEERAERVRKMQAARKKTPRG